MSLQNEDANKKNGFAVGHREIRLSRWTAQLEEQRAARLAETERPLGGLFDSTTEKAGGLQRAPPIAIVNPEMSFVSMLRFGMLALELLPDNSSAGSLYIVFTGFRVFLSYFLGLGLGPSRLPEHLVSQSFFQFKVSFFSIISKESFKS